MLNRGFSAELRRVVTFTLLAVVVGLLNGHLTWTLIIGGALYMAWMLWQIHRLDAWLQSSRDQDPPDAGGIWGDVFDNIHRLQKRQQREKDRLKQVVRRGQETTAALREGIILLDRYGNIDWFNGSAVQLLQLRSQDQGHPLVNFIRHPAFVQYLERKNFELPLDLPSPHSEAVRLQYQVTNFGLGEHLVLVRDVTRVHKLEQMRKDFVANVSHELRTPLTVILGYVETLGMAPDVPEKWRKALDQVEAQGKRMSSLLSDLIVLSKLETDDSKTAHKPVMLKPLLQQIKSDAEVFSGDRGHQITLSCPDELQLLGSDKELQSAFSNLVLNAVKYSGDHTAIHISVSQSSLGVNVAVRDEGAGIDPVHLPRLTERFYRVDNSRHSGTGGTGLGLAIVKHALLRHGAKLDIESYPGKGSTFTCIFPIQRVVAADAPLPYSSRAIQSER